MTISLGLTIALVCVFLFFIGLYSVSALCKAAAKPIPPFPTSDTLPLHRPLSRSRL